MTRSKYFAKVKKQLLREGIIPIKAVYDAGGNCMYCGEAGRCPGWHRPEEALGNFDEKEIGK